MACLARFRATRPGSLHGTSSPQTRRAGWGGHLLAREQGYAWAWAGVILLWLQTVPAADFYVSPAGNDDHPGTETQPFATLERARDAVRVAKGTVWIRGGSYFLAHTFVLGPPDSGTTYRAYPNEIARITGGREIADFRPYRGAILKSDLKAQGITNYGQLKLRGLRTFGQGDGAIGLELFFRDKPLPLARWPNRGWAYIAAVPADPNGGRFGYSVDRPRRWLNSPDVWVHGYWSNDWADSHEKVVSIDVDKREIATAPPHGIYGYTVGRRWRALNLLEELDEPGEWYLDRATGVLYFWPPTTIGRGDVWVSLLEEPLVRIENAEDVLLQGVVLEYGRNHGVEIRDGARNRLSGCKVRNVGGVGVSIQGGKDHQVTECEIAYTGQGGVLLDGGDRVSLTPARHTAARNHIHHYSRWVRTYNPAIQLKGVGNRAINNLIHHAPHVGILLAGNDHLIEGNDLHTLVIETSDAGILYLGRDWTMRGNVLRGNFFHNAGDIDVNAVYLDDLASGTRVLRNLFHRAGRGVLIGGGRDNLVENNLFVDGNPAVQIDARGLTWAAIRDENSTLRKGLKAVPYLSPLWAQRYPRLVGILEEEPGIPKGNIIRGNFAFRGSWIYLRNGTEKWVRLENNRIGVDPGFVDAAKNDFRLRIDSPAFPLVSVEKIGLPGVSVPVIHGSIVPLEGTRVRVTVENLGRVRSAGTFTLWMYPEEGGTWSADPYVPFSLDPGESIARDFETRLAPGVTQIRVGIEQEGEDLKPIGIEIPMQ